MHTIRSKLFVMLSMTVAGLLILTALNFILYAMTENGNAEKTALLEAINSSNEIKYYVASARMNEQKYLQTPNQDSADKLEHNITLVKEEFATINEQIDNKELQAQFAKMEDITDSYYSEFSKLEKSYQEIGYIAEQGLRGVVENTSRKISSMTIFLKDPFIDQRLATIKSLEEQFLLTKNGTFYDQYRAEEGQLRDYLEADTEIEDNMRNNIFERMDEYQRAMSSISNAFNQTDMSISTFNQMARTIDTTISNVQTSITDIEKDVESELNSHSFLFSVIIYLISFVIIIALSLIGWFLLKNIANSIKNLKDGAVKIGNGDFSHRVVLDSGDEMEALATTFNQMAEKVQKSLLHISSSADQLQASSQHLAAISEETSAQANEVDTAIKQVAEGASNQALQLEESQELLQSVQKAIGKTEILSKEILTEAANSEKEGQGGLQTVQDLQAVSDNFLILANHLTGTISDATKQSENIFSIVKTIQDIAENTNLLALNAAIEAARAGDAGRGFAVVANEVRKLAERSKAEAKQIQELITSMNGQMQKLVNDANKFSEYKVLQGSSVASTKAAFDKIVAHVAGINHKVHSIEQSIQLVHKSNQHLSERMEEINTVSQNSAAVSEEVAASSESQLDAISKVTEAANELSIISSELHGEVSQFHIIGKSKKIEKKQHKVTKKSIAVEKAITSIQHLFAKGKQLVKKRPLRKKKK
ncbi:methyl-accepting chemotaxis protein [Bacillaceae bacterium Marseille-Q3522]|nr:methyl-accepting chemotaxis protein [Bacillaceae bacterium Marseille-Q3522]